MVDWFTFGEWHLDPQGGRTEEVVFEVWDGLNPEMGGILEDWVFWLTIGD